MASGTIALVICMYFCARTIEKSTNEIRWLLGKLGTKQACVSWIQRETMVINQQFDSYLIQRPVPEPRTGIFWRFFCAFPMKLCGNHPFRITRSLKFESIQQQNLTIIATSISVCGFVVQLYVLFHDLLLPLIQRFLPMQ